MKEEAQLITQEGELITKIEKAMINDGDYDMKGYIEMAEEIARKKLKMYSSLYSPTFRCSPLKGDVSRSYFLIISVGLWCEQVTV